MTTSELAPAPDLFLKLAGDWGLVEFWPAEERLELDGVDRGVCSELDLKWSKSTKEEQDDWSSCFLAGFGGDLAEVTDWKYINAEWKYDKAFCMHLL